MGVRPSLADTVLPYHSMKGPGSRIFLAVVADYLSLVAVLILVGHVVL